MAHRVLSKDMANLVQAMKLAIKYSKTTLDAEYRKGMLGSAHALALDAKNLLDVVDSVRMRIKLPLSATSSHNGQQPEVSSGHSATCSQQTDDPSPGCDLA